MSKSISDIPPPMNATRSASDLSPAPARNVRLGNPFASLKQERTVEAKVPMQVLRAAQGLPAGGATRAYQVPDELLELARRKKAEHAQRVSGAPLPASTEAHARSDLPGKSEVNLLTFPESSHSARVTLTEELRVVRLDVAPNAKRKPLLPRPLIYAIASVMTYLIVRLILK